mgnify:CR=1 FL=1
MYSFRKFGTFHVAIGFLAIIFVISLVAPSSAATTGTTHNLESQSLLPSPVNPGLKVVNADDDGDDDDDC